MLIMVSMEVSMDTAKRNSSHGDRKEETQKNPAETSSAIILQDRVGSDTDYNIDIRHELVFRLVLQLGLS
jgi:hypothetical protein